MVEVWPQNVATATVLQEEPVVQLHGLVCKTGRALLGPQLLS